MEGEIWTKTQEEYHLKIGTMLPLTRKSLRLQASHPKQGHRHKQACSRSPPYGGPNPVPPWLWTCSLDWKKCPLLKPPSSWHSILAAVRHECRDSLILHNRVSSEHQATPHSTWERNCGRSRGPWDHVSSHSEVIAQLTCPHYAAC